MFVKFFKELEQRLASAGYRFECGPLRFMLPVLCNYVTGDEVSRFFAIGGIVKNH